MKLTITATGQDMGDYMREIRIDLEDGMASGHVGPNAYWDSGDDFADAPTPEQVVEKVFSSRYFDFATFAFGVERREMTAHQIRNLMIFAVKEARK